MEATVRELKPRSEEKAAPAFVFRLASQVGKDGSMEITFGLPADMRPVDMNAYIDKVRALVDRQNDIGLLEVTRAHLDGAKKQLLTQREQRAAHDSKARLAFIASGRKGEYKAHGSDAAALDNFDKTIKRLSEELIPEFEAQISALQRKIAGDA